MTLSNTLPARNKIVIAVTSSILLWCSLLNATIPISRQHKDEFLLGLYLTSQVEKHFEVIDDHPDWARIVEISSRILVGAGSSHLYSFQIIKAPAANAFALPGGFIFITDKLLDLKLTDDELAFLLSHEISHVQKKHFSRLQQKQQKVTILNALATLGSIFLMKNSQNSKDRHRVLKQGSYDRHGPPPIEAQRGSVPSYLTPILAGNIFGTLYLLHSQRDFEMEADYAGALLALKAGYSLEKGMSMLQKLFYSNYRNAEHLNWQTHPLTNDRVDALKGKLDQRTAGTFISLKNLTSFQYQYAERYLYYYDNLLNWERPSFFRTTNLKLQELRSILLDRISRTKSPPIVNQTALHNEISNHLFPQIKEQPFSVGNYGELAQTYRQMIEVGGTQDSEWESEIFTKEQDSLKHHLSKMAQRTPGYSQLKYMIDNFPNHKEYSNWVIMAWKKEPDDDKKVEQSPSLLAKYPHLLPTVTKHLLSMTQSEEDNPYRYRTAMHILKKSVVSKRLSAILKKCESLEYLAKYQHEYPQDPYIELVLKRKSELTERRFKQGQLFINADQYSKAVDAFHEILLYSPGSPLEPDAQNQIYKLNTLRRKSTNP